jgi:pimeloyl-ACP methyl ester carboxylesterase
LLLVHGTSSDHTRWDPVLGYFESARTVYAMDRRGRGESSDTDDYSILDEFADVQSVIDALADSHSGPIDVLAHSYGAVCTVEAALSTSNIRRLALYEPPLPVTSTPITDFTLLASLQVLAEQGDWEEVVTTFMQQVVGVPDEEFEMLRADPGWERRIDAAHTIPRELTALNEGYEVDPAMFQSIAPVTLLLLGTESRPFLAEATETLAAAIPDNRLVMLHGQGHNAMSTAPEYFAQTVLTFLEGGELEDDMDSDLEGGGEGTKALIDGEKY